MRQRNIGERQQIFTNSICIDGVITSITRVDNGDMRGCLEQYAIDDYGETQSFWYPDNEITSGRVESRRNRSMIPPEYVYKKANDFNWSKYSENVEAQKKIANSFIIHFQDYRREGRGLFIFSKTKGSGKTMLACCLANEVMSRYDTSVKFITVPEYIELITEKNEAAQECKNSLKECGILILDDIGAENSKQEWISSALFRLIDYRDKNILPTIYTSNYEMDALPEDERTVDRIIGHSVPLKMPEFSVRRNQAEAKTGEFLRQVLKE